MWHNATLVWERFAIMSENQETKASDSAESFDDGIPAFLKIPQNERNAAAKKLAAEREAQKRSIAIRPDLIAAPATSTPIIVSQPVAAKVEATPAPKTTKTKTAPKAVKTKSTKVKAQPEKLADEAPQPSQTPSDFDPTAAFPGSRLVAKKNTKHSNRKISGRAQFPKIAALVTNKWVPRSVICQHIDVVDNTTRCYLGQMGHTPEYANLICRPAPRKSGEKAQTEYRLVVVT